MTIDLKQFLLADTSRRLAFLKRNEASQEVKDYFGPKAFSDYCALAGTVDAQHLGAGVAKNLIFVPGVMGSYFISRGMGGKFWWIDIGTRDRINRLRLSPDGLTDATMTDDIAPVSIDPTYEPFLTAIINRDDFNHEFFAYDWRKSLNASTNGLKGRIEALYSANGEKPIHVVAHSMGGLLVRATLRAFDGLWEKVDKIAFVGTPHYGSPAIAEYLKNHLWGFDMMGVLAFYLSRETYRSFRGVLSMLPAPRGIYPGTRHGEPHPCANEFDFYNVDNWMLSLTDQEKNNLQQILGETAAFHEDLYKWHHCLDQECRAKMLTIIGVGIETLFQVGYMDGQWYKTKDRVKCDPNHDGDGRVPIASANLDDVGASRYVLGVHLQLPNAPSVYNDVFRWLKDEPLQLPATCEEALSAHLAPAEMSVAPTLDGTQAISTTGDAGLWNAPDLAATCEYVKRLESGDVIPEFNRVRIM